MVLNGHGFEIAICINHDGALAQQALELIFDLAGFFRLCFCDLNLLEHCVELTDLPVYLQLERLCPDLLLSDLLFGPAALGTGFEQIA